MRIKRQFLRTGLVWTTLLLLVLCSQPAKLPVLLLIVPFLLLFAAVYTTWLLAAALWHRTQNRGERVIKKQMAATFSAFVVLLAVMESLGQLNLKDIITFGLLFVLGYFYITRWASRTDAGS